MSPAAATLAGYIPCDLYNAYYLNGVSQTGAGVSIAVITAWDQPNIASDLGTFDAMFGLPGPPSFTIHAMSPFASTDTATRDGWATETTLDVEWAHAMAPGARLVLVEAVSDQGADIIKAIGWAVDASGGNADIVSMSFAGPEYSRETGDDGTFLTGSAGKLFFAAAGDSGSGAMWPSASPGVISVGGTTLPQAATGDAPNAQRSSSTTCGSPSAGGATSGNETVWAGGGGGVSSIEAAPPYQSAFSRPYSTSNRTTPDVAAVADPVTGVTIYDSYSYSGTTRTGWLCCIGGTSLATPVWAGIAARSEEAYGAKLSIANGYTSSPIYSADSSNFTDIGSGSNGQPAIFGYDLASGRGSPRGAALLPGRTQSVTVPYQFHERTFVGVNADGRLEFFLHDSNGQVSHGWQTAAGGGWYCCAPLGLAAAGEPAVAGNQDGRLEVFVRGGDGRIWHSWQVVPGGGWAAGPLGGQISAADPVAARNQDGRLEVFWVSPDNQLWHTWQVAPGGAWGPMVPLGSGNWSGTPSVGSEADGRLDVLLRGSDGQLWHIVQLSPGGGWGSYAPIGGNWPGDPKVATNADGRLEVFMRGPDNQVWHAWEAAPGASSSWVCCFSLGASVAAVGDLTPARNADGRLEVFWRGADNTLEHSWQVAANSSWGAGGSMGQNLGADPAVARNRDGRLEAFWIMPSGVLAHNWQIVPNSGWAPGGALAAGPWPSN